VLAFCIGDEDTVRGFRLAGVPGEVASTAGEAAAALARARRRPDCALLVVTEQASVLLGPALAALRAARDGPAVVEIPGPGGAQAATPGDGVARLVRSIAGAALEDEP
jgi:vacuolar-type H+-ATPase subunit F/Vma7